MKSNILCSIHLYWAYQIFKKTKTLEIRKSKPVCPATVYLYISKNSYKDLEKIPKEDRDMCKNWIGKVALKFTLNQVDIIEICDPDILLNGQQKSWNWFKNKSCLDAEQLMSYIGYGNDHDGWCMEYDNGYAWHIDNLKIYDKPKELSEFRKDLDCDDYPCNKNCDCRYNYYDHSEGCWACGIDFDGANCIYKQIKRPPQSWCYVEEMKDE